MGLLGDTIRRFVWGHGFCLGTRSRFKKTNRVMSPQNRRVMSPQNAYVPAKLRDMGFHRER
jgi:hypothetical protein